MSIEERKKTESSEMISKFLSIAILCARADLPEAVIPVRKYNKFKE